jgi:hypothetical protein
MPRRSLRAACASAATIAIFLLLSVPSFARDYDCSDFPTQRAAQRWFKHHHPHRDPSRLDADHDGLACEDNP